MLNKAMDNPKLRQYILTGAGIGLYFGWFFRPMRDPSLYTVVGLSLVITVVMTLLRLYRGERKRLIQSAGATFVQFALVIAMLEARHFAFDFGGRFAVIIFTTIMGAVSGYWMAYKEVR